MLEKIAGVAAVTKLRAILLMEADFNFHNKLIFGKRMLDLARAHDLVPEEIYSAKGKTLEDAILHQVCTTSLGNPADLSWLHRWTQPSAMTGWLMRSLPSRYKRTK